VPRSTWGSARAAGEHDGGPAHRASIRCREAVRSGRRTADRQGRESAGGNHRPACRAKGQGVGGYASARAYCAPAWRCSNERDWGSQYELTFSLWLERAERRAAERYFEKAEQLIVELLQSAGLRKSIRRPSTSEVQFQRHEVENRRSVASALTCLRLFGIDLLQTRPWSRSRPNTRRCGGPSMAADREPDRSAADDRSGLQAAIRCSRSLVLPPTLPTSVCIACRCAAW